MVELGDVTPAAQSLLDPVLAGSSTRGQDAGG